jgi:hypothetical protein
VQPLPKLTSLPEQTKQISFLSWESAQEVKVLSRRDSGFSLQYHLKKIILAFSGLLNFLFQWRRLNPRPLTCQGSLLELYHQPKLVHFLKISLKKLYGPHMCNQCYKLDIFNSVLSSLLNKSVIYVKMHQKPRWVERE